MTPEFLAYVLSKIGLTQRQLSALVGQSVTSVNSWVKGRAPVPPWLPLWLAMWIALTEEQREEAIKNAKDFDES